MIDPDSIDAALGDYVPLTPEELAAYDAEFPTMTPAQCASWRVRIRRDNAHKLAEQIRLALTLDGEQQKLLLNAGFLAFVAGLLIDLSGEIALLQTKLRHREKQLAATKPPRAGTRWPKSWGRG